MKINIIKMPEKLYSEIREVILKASPVETAMFGIARVFSVHNKKVFLLNRIITLDKDEIEASRLSVRPKAKTVRGIFEAVSPLFCKGYCIVYIHSHPFTTDRVSLSSIDWKGMREDQKILARWEKIPFPWIVFNLNADSFEGKVVYAEEIVDIDDVIVVGKGINKLSLKDDSISADAKEVHARTLLFPYFDYKKISNLDISVVGTGGLGSSVIIALIMEGIGERGTLILIDPDRIEASNLSRIAYGTFHDIGKNKVDIAEKYIKTLRPERVVEVFANYCWDKVIIERLISSDCIISCTDTELGRLFLNSLSHNYLVPLFDLATGARSYNINNENVFNSGGQVRMFIPGETRCLLCSDVGLNHAQASIELSKIEAKEHRVLQQTLYYKALANDAPQPSVFHLNQVIANIGISILIRYLLCGEIATTIHYTNEERRLVQIPRSIHFEDCPICMNTLPGEGNTQTLEDFFGLYPEVPMLEW
jgi:molybdopterin/thiamine biosynthesis adenylyltransferase